MVLRSQPKLNSAGQNFCSILRKDLPSALTHAEDWQQLYEHLPEFPRRSLAVSIANVTGYSVITGLCYALEPLMSQAYGAQQFHEVGYQLQRGMTILLFCTLPIVAMWCYMEPILILLGQDHAVAKMAGVYIVHLIPDACIICLVMPLRIYLTAQVGDGGGVESVV
jgi:hypothetical protein